MLQPTPPSFTYSSFFSHPNSRPWTRSQGGFIYIIRLLSFIFSSDLIPIPIISNMPSIDLPLTIKKHSQVDVRLANNRLLPILSIYPDLLEYIFLLSVNSPTTTTIQQRQRAAISYSQTCHDWRTVAISIKTLWSGLVDFEANSKAWNRELLKRSYPSPIVVGTMAHALRSCRVISAELAHLERMRVYRVGFEPKAWDILLEGLQQPAPHLEYLNISHCIGHNDLHSFVLPSTLFAGDAPRLKRLEMTQCLVDFKAPVLRSLVTLSIENLNASMALTPLEWLDHLKRLPSLTTLRLINAMRPPSSHSTSSSSSTSVVTQLSHLSALHVDASLPELSVFLEGLEFPVSCGLMMSCNDSYPGPELDVVLEVYVDRLDYAHRVRPEQCPFFIYAQRSTVSIWNEQPFYHSSNVTTDSSHDSKKTPPRPSLCLDLNLLGGFEFGCWESLLTPVLYTLRESFSTFTSIQLQLPMVHPGLLPCLVRATRLTQLINVSAVMTKKLLSHIQQQPSSSSSSSSSSSIPLPALDTIMFSDDESMWGAPYRSFVSFLSWRRRVGYPVDKVVFKRCWVLEDTVVSLELLGVQVECESAAPKWDRL